MSIFPCQCYRDLGNASAAVLWMDLAAELPGNTKEVTLSREQKQILPFCSAPVRSQLGHCIHREQIQSRDKSVGGIEAVRKG